jgi:hypothetical protein
MVLATLLTLVSAQAPIIYPVDNQSSGLVQSNASQYSHFYQMISGPAPSNKISAPVRFDILGHTPTTVFLTNENNAVPYSRYQSNINNTTGNSLWIQGTKDWAQHAVVPQGSTVSLIAISPVKGIGNLNFKDSDGQMYNYSFYFYSNSRLTFYADKPGRYELSLVSGNMSSNAVVIDVTGMYNPPSNNLSTPISRNNLPTQITNLPSGTSMKTPSLY